MKSDFELFNELSHRTHYLHEMSAEESADMKKALLAMYKDIAALCQQHGLTQMLCGGSALGAVRHQGFIPWDDDLDMLMPRADYDRLLQLVRQGALGDLYTVDAPDAHADSKNVWMKIYRRDSLNLDIYTSTDAPFPTGLYIDIFALDAVPRTRCMQAVKGFLANALQFAAIVTLYHQYPNPRLQEFMSLDPQLKRRYRIKRVLGAIVGIVPHRLWAYWYDCFVSDARTDRPLGIPTGRKYYNGEIFPPEVYLPVTTATFENETVFLPAQYDRYLTNLYHDYMQLPPVEKRERHFICELRLPKI